MFAELLEKLKRIPDNWQKRLFFAALITRALAEKGLRPIVVGGHAVEFYTLGGYATRDIDVIVADSEPLNRILMAWGFKREGRHWYSEELDLAIESPASTLAGDITKISEVEVEGLAVYLIGIEDIIIDRLNALVHWKSERDGEWAEEMLVLHRNRMDMGYLVKRAREEGTQEALQEMLARMEG